MDFLKVPLFQVLFNTSVPRVLLKADAPNFTIVTYNDAYKIATHIGERDIKGMYLWDAFNPDEAGGDGGKVLSDALTEGALEGLKVLMPPFHYDIPSADRTSMEISWWQLEIDPIPGEDSKPEYLLTTTYNITEKVLNKQAIQEGLEREQSLSEKLHAANEELTAANEELSAANEELASSYEELIFSQASLQDLNKSLETKVEQRTQEQVLAMKNLERAEKMYRFAIESAGVGTFFINAKTHEFIPSIRMKELYGFYENEEMPFDAAVLQIPHEYRDKVTQAVDASFEKGEDYKIEHPVIGFHDQKVRWVKALGKLDKDDLEKYSHFSGIIIDITEQKQHELRKNDFISIVSHELKTPLTSLKGYMQLLIHNAEKAGDLFLATTLGRAESRVDKMTTLINGFLNVSQLEAGKIQLNLAEFDLVELIKETMDDASSILQGNQILFKSSKPLLIIADRDKISQVLTNFMTNAAKYSPKGSFIKISCELVDGFATVGVTDQGIGIEAGDQSFIFDRFYRVESTQNKTISGFGIGLYICSEIIYHHNGKIYVNSKPGKGSTFYFSLPNQKT